MSWRIGRLTLTEVVEFAAGVNTWLKRIAWQQA
jgi:hypothetical protein